MLMTCRMNSVEPKRLAGRWFNSTQRRFYWIKSAGGWCLAHVLCGIIDDHLCQGLTRVARLLHACGFKPISSRLSGERVGGEWWRIIGYRHAVWVERIWHLWLPIRRNGARDDRRAKRLPMSTCQHRSMTCLLDGLSLPSHRSFDSNELSIQQSRCGAISSIVDASHKKTKKKTKTPVELEGKNKSCPNRLQGLTISFACPSTLPPLLQRGGPVVFKKNKNKNTICTYIQYIQYISEKLYKNLGECVWEGELSF